MGNTLLKNSLRDSGLRDSKDFVFGRFMIFSIQHEIVEGIDKDQNV